jgi:hypothetical protein
MMTCTIAADWFYLLTIYINNFCLLQPFSFAAVVVVIVLFYRSRLWVFSKNAELAVAKGL